MIKIGDMFTCKELSFHEYSYGSTAEVTKVYPKGGYQLDNEYDVTFTELEDFFCEYDCPYAKILREDSMYM